MVCRKGWVVLLRLGRKTLALVVMFLVVYLVYNLAVLLLVEVFRVSPLPLHYPWALVVPFSWIVGTVVAVSLYRGLSRIRR